MSSCQSKSKLTTTTYFNQRKDSILATIVKAYEPVIHIGDRISIIITALDPASVAPFNMNLPTGSGSSSIGYLVENDGTVNVPQLGKIFVEGYKRVQLQDTVAGRLAKFVNNAIVNVQIVNFKITVLGEVSRPGILNIPEGKANIIDVLGLAGDLLSYAKRENIMIIREKNNKREFGEINVLSINVFNSPYYNLQQNDIVYVEPTKAKVTTSEQNLLRNLSVITSVLSVVSTIFFLIINFTK